MQFLQIIAGRVCACWVGWIIDNDRLAAGRERFFPGFKCWQKIVFRRTQALESHFLAA